MADLSSVVVRPIEPAEEARWDGLMSRHHYLGFERLVGESLKYVAHVNGHWLALLGWGTSAFQCGSRDWWIGWAREQQWRRLRYIVINQRFLILPGVRVKNLASRALGLYTRRLSNDWEATFGHKVVLAEIFVDHHRFSGTCYRAAGREALAVPVDSWHANASLRRFHARNYFDVTVDSSPCPVVTSFRAPGPDR